MVRYRLLMGVLNGAIFYAGWVLCLVSPAQGWAWLGILGTFALMAIQLSFSHQRWKDVKLAVLVAAIGTLFDSLYQGFGLISFQSPNVVLPWLAPFWITTLYALLAVSIDNSLLWLRGRQLLAAPLGVLGGVATYLAGERMGAAHFESSATLPIIAIVWLFFFPGVFALSDWLDGN